MYIAREGKYDENTTFQDFYDNNVSVSPGYFGRYYVGNKNYCG